MLNIKDIYNRVLGLFNNKGFNKIESQTLDIIDLIEENIEEHVIPTIELLLDQPDVLKRVEKFNFYKTAKSELKIHNLEDLLKNCKRYALDVKVNLDKLRNITKGTLNNGISQKTMSYKQLTVCQLVDEILSNLLFMNRMFYLFLRDDKNSVLPNQGIINTLRVLSVFKMQVLNGSSMKDRFEEISKLPTDSIYDRVNLDVPNMVATEGINITGDFLKNPIYQIRKWLVERDLKNLEIANETKTLIELRLYDLRAEIAGGEENDKLRKQIEYYEDKLAAIDAKISKLQEI